METKHTKGKWQAIKNPNHFSYILIKSDYGNICRTPLDEDEDVANAKLIAAAPELLEALVKSNKLIETLRDKLSHIKYGIIISEQFIKDNLAAIKKATE